MSTAAVSYRHYLESPEWYARRSAALEAAGWKCENCGSTVRLETHPRTYRHLGAERLNELVIYCRRCHRRAHGIEGKTA